LGSNQAATNANFDVPSLFRILGYSAERLVLLCEFRIMAKPAMNSFSETQVRTSQLFDKWLVLIVGVTRWGTAWVQQCLDAHPDICAKGEGHFTDLLFPKIATAFDDYNSESDKIGNRLQLAGLSGNAAGYTFDDVDHVVKVAILDRWLDGRNPSCVIEKTPEHVLNLDLLLRVLPCACVIYVLRDGRDGRDEAVSAWEFNLGISRGDFLKKFRNFASFAENFAQAWSRSIGAGRKFGQKNQTRYLEIQSSDITVNPSSVVAALLDLSEVSSTQKIAQNCANMA
jgi:hypothetical protein